MTAIYVNVPANPEVIDMLTKKDWLILAYLRQNARMKLTTMSRHTRLPVSTIFDRLAYYKGNVVKKHIAVINFASLGYYTRAHVMLKANKKGKEKLKEFLLKHSHVNSLYRINNGFDFLLECIFKNINEMEEFLDTIEDEFSVRAKEVYYVVEDIKREMFLSDPELVKMEIG